jgi:hypothetical protein
MYGATKQSGNDEETKGPNTSALCLAMSCHPVLKCASACSVPVESSGWVTLGVVICMFAYALSLFHCTTGLVRRLADGGKTRTCIVWKGSFESRPSLTLEDGRTAVRRILGRIAVLLSLNTTCLLRKYLGSGVVASFSVSSGFRRDREDTTAD